MNYSEQTYGRKIIRGKPRKRISPKTLYASFGICFLIGLIVGLSVFWGIKALTTKEVIPFGKIEVEQFDNETPIEWTNSVGVDFIPLDVPMDEELQKYVYLMSNSYNIDFPFVMAVIEHESSFKPEATSGTNDFGLMQINKLNHAKLTEKLGVTDFFDPYQNIHSGIYILSDLFEKYETPNKVLMAYNIGEGGAKKLWNQGVLETGYSRSILKKCAEYNKFISEKKGGEQ